MKDGISYYSAADIEITHGDMHLKSGAKPLEPKHGVIYCDGPVLIHNGRRCRGPVLRWRNGEPRNFSIGIFALSCLRSTRACGNQGDPLWIRGQNVFRFDPQLDCWIQVQ